MALHQISKLKDYLKYLQEKPKEVEALFNDLLIGVTSFFRDPEAFEILSEKGISSIISTKSSGDTIRVWIPGCSTGEEAYTLAILLDEAINAQKKDLRFQIFASDINEKAINSARLGIYPESHSSQISPARLKRYFQVESNSFRIKKEIRDKVIFATQNVINDPPFSKLDMISCRNLLIYINPTIQQKIFKIFNYALNPKGILFLGNSESLGESSDLFSTIDRKFKLFSNKAVNSVLPLEFDEYMTEPIKQKENTSSLKRNQLNVGIGEITEKLLLTKYAPACAIINKKGDAIYFSGNTEKYLKPLQGKASLNITELAREGLAVGLRNTIDKARKSNKEVESNNLMVKTNGIIQTLKLIVKPITQFELDENYFMVIFEDQNETEIANITSKNENKNETFTEILALEQELNSTKEFLRSTIEELEGANQELKASFEELQSSNEELQSSNEELETSKEELQSMNEEMITVNNELQLKNNELAQSYGDMNNLLATTQIGTLFLDRELKIRRFTPSIVNIINIITSDIGRPMIDLSLNIQYTSFIKDIKKVMEQLEPIQRVVNGKDNLSYLVRIIPYLSSENSVNGVVITFVDITKEMEAAAKEKEVALKYKDLLKHTKSYIYKQDKQLKYIEFFAFENGWLSEDIIGKNESDIIKNKIDADNLIKLKNKVMKTGVPIIKEIIITVNNKTSYFNLLIRPWLNNEKEIQGVACIASDISEFKMADIKTP
jgi:two-component system CheB/CheR fusion protein